MLLDRLAERQETAKKVAKLNDSDDGKCHNTPDRCLNIQIPIYPYINNSSKYDMNIEKIQIEILITVVPCI